MLNSSVIKIIQSFTREEISEFEFFLQSPYFNKKSGVIKLFSEIKQFAPEFKDEGLKKELIWQKIYPEKEFNYGVMKNLLHELNKQAEQFITQQEYKTNRTQEFANLYTALFKRNVKSALDSKGNILRKEFDDLNLRNININIEEYFHILTRVNELKTWVKHFHEMKVPSVDDRMETEDSFITGMLIHLIIVFYTSYEFSIDVKDKIYEDSPSALVLKSISDEVFHAVMESIKKRSDIKYKILKIQFLAYKAATNHNDSAHYFRFKNFFYEHYDILPKSSIRDMDVFIVNTVSLIVNKDFDKEKEFYDIYKFKHKNHLILDKNGKINTMQFIPWSVIFMEENKPRDLNEFYTTYKDFLIETEKRDASLVVEAMICFLNGELGKSLSIISKTKFDSFILKNFVKKITVLIYYEMGDYEMFLQAWDALKHFLGYAESENKIERKDNIERTKYLCRSIDKLFKLRESGNTHDIELFELEMKSRYLEFSKWFQRKIDELRKKK
jgi:hypothetical protein